MTAVLVMAACPWCKLAVGSQVAHMTVIDVQVFGSSHTGTPELRAHAGACTKTQTTCVHSGEVQIHAAAAYLHNYTRRPRISLRCRGSVNNKPNKCNREYVHTAAGLSGKQQEFLFCFFHVRAKTSFVKIPFCARFLYGPVLGTALCVWWDSQCRYQCPAQS